MWRNYISGPDACGGITYPDQVGVERNDVSGPGACGGMTYPNQVGVEE
jgi:hypothetical protein